METRRVFLIIVPFENSNRPILIFHKRVRLLLHSLSLSLSVQCSTSMAKSSSTTLSHILSSSSSSSSIQSQTPKIQLLNLGSLSVKTATYTSLRDVLPYSAAAVNSPAANQYDVPIRNRLVKQAAWAYLQPMSTSPSGGPSGPHFFRRNRLATCLSFIYHHILPSLTRTLHRILHIFPCFLPVILWYHNNI